MVAERAGEGTANYHVHLFFAAARVSPDEANRIRGALSEVLECPLAELPRAIRGERGRWEAEPLVN